MLDGIPQNLNNTFSKRFTFTFVGENLSTTSSIIVTPLFSLRLGCSIDYSRVVDANTIEIVMSNRSGAGQPFTNGTDGTFNITVIEF